MVTIIAMPFLVVLGLLVGTKRGRKIGLSLLVLCFIFFVAFMTTMIVFNQAYPDHYEHLMHIVRTESPYLPHFVADFWPGSY